MSFYQELLEKIESKSAKIAILGIGYVGFELGRQIANAGFETIGFDTDEKKVENLKEEGIENYLGSTDFEKVKGCDIVFLCVPTPVHEDKTPDLEAVRSVTQTVAKYLRKGQLIVFESTVAPGTTRNIILPELEKTGFKIENEVFLAYSPHRIDFTLENFSMQSISKVASGIGENSSKLIESFYSKVLDQVVMVSSVEVAELVKILENTFRFVNINLINEISTYARDKNINMFEVVKAASTKPFGYMPFYPGVGVGGHCIPVDPYYLLQDAKDRGIDLTILEKSMIFHEKRLKAFVKEVLELLKKHAKTPYKVLLIGVSVKPQSPDVRESVGEKVLEGLEENGVQVSYHDPYVKKLGDKTSVDLTKEVLEDSDLVIILTPHKNIDYTLIEESKTPILDTKNVFPDKTVYRF